MPSAVTVLFSSRQLLDFGLGVPGDPLAAIAYFGQQRSQGGEHLVDIGIIPLYHQRVAAWFYQESARIGLFSSLSRPRPGPVRRGVSCKVGTVTMSFSSPKCPGTSFGEFLRQAFVNIPIRTGFPSRIHRL